MRILVIGGTGFFGTHVTLGALARGHDVTLLHRGHHPLPPAASGARELLGDRFDQATLDRAGAETWDAVIDTNCYFPRAARTAIEALGDVTAHYVLISTVSVYTEDSPPWAPETWPLATIADESSEEINGDTYGALKALSEVEVISRLGGRACVIRPGLIVGPGDGTDRFTYWCRRLRLGGDVLVPAPQQAPVQYVDARDLAGWTVRIAEGGQGGVFNATGPADTLTMEGLVTGISDAVQSHPTLHWVKPDFLLEQGVEPWSEIPLWSPASLRNMTFDISGALGAGLNFRPLAETARDTLAWASGRPWPGAAGLSSEREAELLRLWTLHR